MNEPIRLPRMRNAKQAAEEIRRMDSGTAITEFHVRKIMKRSLVPTIKSGRRLFVDLDMLIEYIATHPDLDFTDEPAIHGVRPVPERARR